MRRLLAVPVLAALGLLVPHAQAAPTALVIPDATGDANFAELHGGNVPAGSQAALDIVSVTWDTTKRTTYKVVKKKRVPVVTPTGLKLTLTMAADAATTPGVSYGVNATHSVCGVLRLQVYYGAEGATPYGDLASCGTGSTTNPEQHLIEFTPVVTGKKVVIQVPFGALPKAFKAGTLVSDISAYTTLAEPVVGYQSTDFEPSAGIDFAVTPKAWKVA